MKTFAIFVVLVIFATASFQNTAALPVTEEIQETAVIDSPDVIAVESADNVQVEEHSRQKRATCDLLSKFNVNHSACAAHCIFKKYKGGYCNNKQVCVCRR